MPTLYRTLNPATQELVEEFQTASSAQLEVSIEKVWTQFNSWKNSTIDERESLLNAIAEKLLADATELGNVITLEMGKPIGDAIAEVKKCASVCRYYTENGGRFLEPQRVGGGKEELFVRFDPLGPVFAIMPWNFPFWQVFRFSIPAFMAGNSVLLKHAPCTPKCGAVIEKLILDAGAPEGLLKSVYLTNEQAADVIADKRMRGVTLTGSARAGRIVASLAGQNLKPSVMELGGTDPFIVLEDADLDKAVTVGVRSRYYNSGQVCCAAKRFLVHSSIFNRFRDAFVAETQNTKVGDPLNEDTVVGPLARSDIRETLIDQVDSTVAAGGKLLCGGKPIERPGYFFEPAVLVDCPDNSAAIKEELFGPAAVLIPFDSDSQAIGISNQSDYGLSATIFSQDKERASKIAQQLEVGSVFVNRMVGSDPRIPFGGVKDSGYGRELAEFGLREFVNIKSVWLE